MASTNQAFTKKLQAAIKAKIQELGVDADNDLAEYVMCLASNKRDKVQMKKELQMFMGKNTGCFVDWLFAAFERIQKTLTELKQQDKTKTAVKSSTKIDEKSSKEQVNEQTKTAIKSSAKIEEKAPDKSKEDKIPEKYRTSEKSKEDKIPEKYRTPNEKSKTSNCRSPKEDKIPEKYKKDHIPEKYKPYRSPNKDERKSTRWGEPVKDERSRRDDHRSGKYSRDNHRSGKYSRDEKMSRRGEKSPRRNEKVSRKDDLPERYSRKESPKDTRSHKRRDRSKEKEEKCDRSKETKQRNSSPGQKEVPKIEEKCEQISESEEESQVKVTYEEGEIRERSPDNSAKRPRISAPSPNPSQQIHQQKTKITTRVHYSEGVQRLMRRTISSSNAEPLGRSPEHQRRHKNASESEDKRHKSPEKDNGKSSPVIRRYVSGHKNHHSPGHLVYSPEKERSSNSDSPEKRRHSPKNRHRSSESPKNRSPERKRHDSDKKNRSPEHKHVSSRKRRSSGHGHRSPESPERKRHDSDKKKHSPERKRHSPERKKHYSESPEAKKHYSKSPEAKKHSPERKKKNKAEEINERSNDSTPKPLNNAWDGRILIDEDESDEDAEAQIDALLDGLDELIDTIPETSILSGSNISVHLIQQQSQTPSPVQSVPLTPIASQSTASSIVADPPSFKKIPERCRFWPGCEKQSQCQYHHPTEVCAVFPNCAFGERCLNIHPLCKFNKKCKKPRCPYTHDLKGVATVVLYPHDVATAQQQLQQQASNPVQQPTTISKAPPLPQLSQLPSLLQPVASAAPCRFGGQCAAVDCKFSHPPPCRFGMLCKNRNCTYTHKRPNLKRFQWTSTNAQ